jgi:diguanylate cyclase (GGDEF)-like protein
MRRHLLWIWVGAAAAVVVATGSGFLWGSDQAGDEAVERMTFRAERAAASVSASVASTTEAVEAVVGAPNLAQVFAQPDVCTLTVPGTAPFADVRLDVVGLDGTVACSSKVSPAVLAAGVHLDSAWLDQVLASSGTLVIWDGVDPVTGAPAVVIAAPVADAAGAAAGAGAVFLHLPETAAALAEDLTVDDSAAVTILDGASRQVVSTSALGLAAATTTAGPQFSAGQGQWADLDGTQRFFGSGNVLDSPWRVYIGAERSAVLADALGVLARQGVIGLLALLLLAIAMIILDRQVAAPFRTVTAAVAAAGRDPNSPHIDEVGTSELVALVRQFNAMLDLRAGHEAQLLYVATHDQLTGLPNAVLLRDRLHDLLQRDRAGADLAVLCLGLDRFKNVNDGFGYDIGDRVLADVADRIKAQLRPRDMLARFGGDEFVIICEGTGAEGALDVVERLQESLQQPFHAGDSAIVLQATIGIAITEPGPSDAERLLREASSAMQQAKEIGNGWRLFTGESQARSARHLALEHELRDALRRDELVVHYQPVLDVRSGHVVGAEALVRWQHPTRGMVPPLDFIPVAEQTGQIGAIGAFVLREACSQAAAWATAGHPLRISVNVAAGQLTHAEFPTLVVDALTTTGLPAAQLCLEITESSWVRHDDNAVGNLRRLRSLGVHLSVDDFGTGYSSLAYLHQLPVDELKVDRSFIARLCDDTRDTHLVQAIVRMAHALGLAVVAEGVETTAQLDVLTGLHCQRVQGNLFAVPQCAQDFSALLAAETAAAATAVLAGPSPTP